MYSGLQPVSESVGQEIFICMLIWYVCMYVCISLNPYSVTFVKSFFFNVYYLLLLTCGVRQSYFWNLKCGLETSRKAKVFTCYCIGTSWKNTKPCQVIINIVSLLTQPQMPAKFTCSKALLTK